MFSNLQVVQPKFLLRNNSMNQIYHPTFTTNTCFLGDSSIVPQDGRWIGDAKERANGKSFRQYGIQVGTSREQMWDF